MTNYLEEIKSNSWKQILEIADLLLSKYENWENERYLSHVAPDDDEDPGYEWGFSTTVKAVDTEDYFSDVREEYRLSEHELNIDIESFKEAVSLLSRSVENKNIELLRRSIHKIGEYLDDFPLDIYNQIEEISTCVESFKIEHAGLIYTPKDPKIIIPELIVPVHADLASLVLKSPSILYSITPRAFEELIAEIFDKRGFDVELTKETRDGGKDIIAISNHMGVSLKYIIECKRYARERKITLDLVQRLYGVKMSESANKAILVTTSNYTKDSLKFASQHQWDLSLKDYNDILYWLQNSNNKEQC